MRNILWIWNSLEIEVIELKSKIRLDLGGSLTSFIACKYKGSLNLCVSLNPYPENLETRQHTFRERTTAWQCQMKAVSFHSNSTVSPTMNAPGTIPTLRGVLPRLTGLVCMLGAPKETAYLAAMPCQIPMVKSKRNWCYLAQSVGDASFAVRPDVNKLIGEATKS